MSAFKLPLKRLDSRMLEVCDSGGKIVLVADTPEQAAEIVEAVNSYGLLQEAGHLLNKFAFVRVLCGMDGDHHYRCRECEFDPDHDHSAKYPELAKHSPDCKVEAVLARIRAAKGNKS